MATRCITHTKARFGVVVKPLARSKSHERACNTLYSYRARPPIMTITGHSIRSLATSKAGSPHNMNWSSSSRMAEQMLAQELETAASVVKSDAVPSEVAVHRALRVCSDLARSVMEPNAPPEVPSELDKTPTSNLLSLDERSRMLTVPSPTHTMSRRPMESQMADKISSTAFSIISNPKVFITRALLTTYLYTQSVLGRPESFPHIFDLYASKPIPQLGRQPITYKDPNPRRASSAVPFVLARSALAAAIEAKDLPLCLSIIDTSVCTTAFKRSKMLRRALLPFSGLALTPAAAYVLAAQMAQYSQGMDPDKATNMTFVGLLTYVGCTATIGFVAITTANDQMDRITWIAGTPLRERWLREEERALVDQVAGAWGFQDVYRRGEEEGEEWEALRDWAFTRGMILDKPELMEGME